MQRSDHKVDMEARCLAELNVVPVEAAVTEPVYTRSMKGTELLSLKEVPLKLSLPATSVAVERAVKDVTQAAAACSSSRERDGLIFQLAESREKVPYKSRNKVMSSK